MPAVASKVDVLVDTSAAVALVVTDHDAHATVVEALRGRRCGLAGHAAFETFSVLTRLPGSMRRPPSAVAQIVARNFPVTRFLSPEGASRLLVALGEEEIGGGAIYDALVGATAVEHGLPLATRDRRALDTYRSLGVDLEVL